MMFQSQLVVAILCVVTATDVAFDLQCDESDRGKILRDPSDCQRWYICDHNVWKEMPRCIDNLVFSMVPEVLGCVPFSHEANDCEANSADILQRICAGNPSAVFSHPKYCQRFYNCSKTTPTPPLAKYEEECPSPEYFDVHYASCKDPKYVNSCGSRQKNVDNSDQCKGLPDGENPMPGKVWTPEFLVCRDDLIVGGVSVCPVHPVLKEKQVFSPEEGRCVSLYEVPKSEGGHPFECEDLEDGVFANDVTDRNDIYFRCNCGDLVIVSCPESKMFDKQQLKCV